jgi:hypothetical protein
MINSQVSLIQYNPVLNMWHGVQRSLNIQLNVPFNLRVSSNTTQQSIKFSFRQTAGMAHCALSCETVLQMRVALTV